MEKLTIFKCTVDDEGNVSCEKSGGFSVVLNPSSYSLDRSIKYTKDKAQGKQGGDIQFSAYDSESIKFDLVLDGTGAAGVDAGDVKTQLKNMEDVVYCYDGKKHEPNVVKLLWGSLVFHGRLSSLSLEYTLFKPTGEPLRAKAKLSFTSFMSAEEEALRAKRSSPDLTHIVEVKAGDTLPLLCNQVYRDSAYYVEIARINNVSNFRDLKPGTRLRFPPLR